MKRVFCWMTVALFLLSLACTNKKTETVQQVDSQDSIIVNNTVTVDDQIEVLFRVTCLDQSINLDVHVGKVFDPLNKIYVVARLLQTQLLRILTDPPMELFTDANKVRCTVLGL